MKKYIGKKDLFESSLGGLEAIIWCSLDFDLEFFFFFKSARLHVLKRSCGGQPDYYFCFGLRLCNETFLVKKLVRQITHRLLTYPYS